MSDGDGSACDPSLALARSSPQDFPLVAPVYELTPSSLGDAASALPPTPRVASLVPPVPHLSRGEEMALQAGFRGPQWNARWQAEEGAAELKRWLASDEAAHFVAPPTAAGRAAGGPAHGGPPPMQQAPGASRSGRLSAALAQQAAAAAGNGGGVVNSVGSSAPSSFVSGMPGEGGGPS